MNPCCVVGTLTQRARPKGLATIAAVTFVSAFCNARGRVSAAGRMRPVVEVGSLALVPFGKNTDLDMAQVGGGLAPVVSDRASNLMERHADGPATSHARYDSSSGPGAEAFARRNAWPTLYVVGKPTLYVVGKRHRRLWHKDS